MDNVISLFYIVAGLVLRLAIPIAGTMLLIFILRKLDARWQAEAEYKPLPTTKVECWKIKGCMPEQMENCPAVASALPCWQVNRLPNGYLNENCLSCKVFIEAPMPALQIESRSL